MATSPEGNKQRKITSALFLLGFSVTPNGSQILYSSESPTEAPSIWRVNVDGSGLKQMTPGTNDSFPVMDSLGRWIVFATWKTGPMTIMKIPAAGGNHIDVSGVPGVLPLLSPDGKTVYFGHMNDEDQTGSFWSVPIDGGKAVPLFDFPFGLSGPFHLRPNASEVSYTVRKDGVDNVWVQPLDGGPPTMYTNFTEDYIMSFDWMPDGKSLVVSHGHRSADVILITQEN